MSTDNNQQRIVADATTKYYRQEKNTPGDDCYDQQNDPIIKQHIIIDSCSLEDNFESKSEPENQNILRQQEEIDSVVYCSNDFELKSASEVQSFDRQKEFNEYQEISNYYEIDPPRNLRNNTTDVEPKVPGETKNLAKGYARSLANFINLIIHDCDQKHEIKQLAENPTLKAFLKLDPEKIGKKKLYGFLETDVGSIVAKYFFGNCKWSYNLIKENKTDVEKYFRYNIIYFEEVIHPQRKQVKI